MKKEDRISLEYLINKGFKAFKEDDKVISYNKTYGISIYVAFEHNNYNVQSNECFGDWWTLMISCKNPQLMLKCECNYIYKFEEILKTFGIKDIK